MKLGTSQGPSIWTKAENRNKIKIGKISPSILKSLRWPSTSEPERHGVPKAIAERHPPSCIIPTELKAP